MPAFSAYHWIALPCVLGLGAVLADEELGGAGAWAIVTACFGAGTIVGSVVGLRWKPGRPMLAASLAFIGASAQPAIIALAGSTAAIAAFEALAGIAVAIGFAQWETTLGRLIPAGALSRVTSLDWFTTVGIMPLGYALAGPIADVAGLHETMVAASVLCVPVRRRARRPRRARRASGVHRLVGLRLHELEQLVLVGPLVVLGRQVCGDHAPSSSLSAACSVSPQWLHSITCMVLSSYPSALSRLNAALMSARWVNAWGKFPSSSPVGPISSEYSPRWFA